MWKDYSELEDSLSMPELSATLEAARIRQYEQNKFMAAIQGVNLDDPDGDGKERGQKEWEDLKARVFSGGSAKDSNDILSLQGINAQQAGFGIGAGLDYTDAKNMENPTW